MNFIFQFGLGVDPYLTLSTRVRQNTLFDNVFCIYLLVLGILLKV